MAMCIGSFQFKSGALLVFFQAAGNAVFILHFIMLGAYSGCVSVIPMVLSNLMLLFHLRGARWAPSAWKWVFVLLTAVSCALTWQDIFSLLPCIGTIAFILTNWSGDSRIMRLGKLTVVGPGWVAYNVYVQSYSGILSESFGMVSALIALVRYRQTKKESGEPDGE